MAKLIRYDVKVYNQRREKETIRLLSYAQKSSLCQLLDRIGLQYKVNPYEWREGSWTEAQEVSP